MMIWIGLSLLGSVWGLWLSWQAYRCDYQGCSPQWTPEQRRVHLLLTAVTAGMAVVLLTWLVAAPEWGSAAWPWPWLLAVAWTPLLPLQRLAYGTWAA